MAHAASAMPMLEVFPGFLQPHEIHDLEQKASKLLPIITDDRVEEGNQDRKQSETTIDTSMLGSRQGPFQVYTHLHPDTVAKLPRDDVSDQDNDRFLMEDAVTARVSCLHQTTHRHKDTYVNGPLTGQPIEEHVFIMFLNSNPNATFVHGDTKVPVEQGNLVLFRADVDHNTVIENGEVRFVGPIEIRSLASGTPVPLGGTRCAVDFNGDGELQDLCAAGFCNGVAEDSVCVECPVGDCVDFRDCGDPGVSDSTVTCGGDQERSPFGPIEEDKCSRKCGCATAGKCQTDDQCDVGQECVGADLTVNFSALVDSKSLCQGNCFEQPSAEPSTSPSATPSLSPSQSPTRSKEGMMSFRRNKKNKKKNKDKKNKKDMKMKGMK